MKKIKKSLIIGAISVSAVLLGLIIWGMVALCNQIEFWTRESDQSEVDEPYKNYQCADPNLVWINSDEPYLNTYSRIIKIGNSASYIHRNTYKKISGEDEDKVIGSLFNCHWIGFFGGSDEYAIQVLFAPDEEVDVWQDWHVSKIEIISVSGYKEMDERDRPYYYRSQKFDISQPIFDVIATTTSDELISELHQSIEILDESPSNRQFVNTKYKIRVSFEESESIVWEADILADKLGRWIYSFRLGREVFQINPENHLPHYTTAFTPIIERDTPLFNFILDAISQETDN